MVLDPMDQTYTGHEQREDPVTRIRAAIAADIAAQRSEPAQIALSRFAARIDQLSPGDLDKVSTQVGSILPALAATEQNIACVDRAIVNIGNTLLKARGGIPGVSDVDVRYYWTKAMSARSGRD
jgi:hypothetical protein